MNIADFQMDLGTKIEALSRNLHKAQINIKFRHKIMAQVLPWHKTQLSMALKRCQGTSLAGIWHKNTFQLKFWHKKIGTNIPLAQNVK